MKLVLYQYKIQKPRYVDGIFLKEPCDRGGDHRGAGGRQARCREGSQGSKVREGVKINFTFLGHALYHGQPSSHYKIQLFSV